MTPTDEIADVIAKIVHDGLRRINEAALAGDAYLCNLEADHIHNLPGLIVYPSWEGVGWYLTPRIIGFYYHGLIEHGSPMPGDELMQQWRFLQSAFDEWKQEKQ